MYKMITLRGLLLLLFGIACLSIPTQAIYESQAGAFDWHHTWIGHPREAFSIDDNHVLVYSDRNVFASINKHTGAIEWRQILDSQLINLKTSDAGILTTSADPKRAQLWNKTNGHLIWEHVLPEEKQFGAAEPILFEDGETSLLLGNNELIKLSKGGNIAWSWIKPEKEGNKLKIREKEGHIYVVVEPEEGSNAPYFFINIIDRLTGETEKTLQIDCHSSFSHITYIGDYIFWIEGSLLKWTPIYAKDIQAVVIQELLKSVPEVDEFDASQISIHGQYNSFIITAEYEEDEFATTQVASALVNIENDGKSLLFKKYFGSHPSFGGIDFYNASAARIYRSGADEFTVYLSPEGKEIKIEHDFGLTGDINYAKILSFEPFRLLIATEGSSVLCFDEHAILWSREEALANIAASEFLDLPEQKMWTQMADELDETVSEQAVENPFSRYRRRLITHLHGLGKLPGWFISHFAGMYGSALEADQHNNKISIVEAQSCWLNNSQPETLYRDNFGLRKLIISVTKTGKIIAQDTSRKGKIVWSRYAPYYSFSQIHVVRAATVKLPPIIVAIGSTVDDMGGEATGFIRLNALTGEDYISSIPESADFFEPVVTTGINVDKVMRLPIEEPEERTHLLAVYETGSGRVFIYPDTTAAREKFRSEFLPKFYFSHQTNTGMQGFKVVEGYRGSLKANLVWNFILPKGEEIITTSKPQAYDKVALLGRALGNRNVAYKYLNPHMFALVSRKGTLLKVRILDAVKGSVLYETTHDNVDTTTNQVHIIQAENWFVYHFWSNDARAKGYQAVVLELFEGKHENERIESTTFSSFDNIQPYVNSAAFAFPYPVSCMGVTTTKNGISTKAIIFGLPTHQIVSINKRLLDPRRPRDKPTKEDMEEMLFPYAPIPDERRFFLTYDLDVAGIQTIITSPSLLESTSLVFSYGLDTFYSRQSPSRQFDVLSEDFSKVQLLLTMLGLGIAILISGPIVRRKRVNALWK
ncbi:hypothetical protein CU097_015490 [Rhizopus azygosporus]|uniref:ER membrane protein complex subunit 1 n=2 Tax=Rhizopus TaxID=4842 RepID=A0A367KG23_RHIAZ|nr:hypothetical protein CU097_015490 [Rhizopus azygosporus]